MKHCLTIMACTALSLPLWAGGTDADGVLDAARRANAYFMAKTPDPTAVTNVKKLRPSSLWTRGVYYEGLMALYEIDPQKEYIEYTDRWADFHKWTPRDGVGTRDADNQCCSQAYLARFSMTGDSAMMRPTRENIQEQMAEGRNDYWTWVDAIQMAMPVYAQMYEITGDYTYIDRAMDMYRWSRNECGGGLFNEPDGLWWRDADFVPPYKEADGNQCYWSRGNGWALAAMVRVMECLKPRDKAYKELKKDFVAMCNALAACQREDGFWNVSLASPATFGGKETTGTALFLYGISWGVRNGLLKAKTFRPVADKAWEAIERDALHADGFLGYVQGTGKEPKDGQPVTYERVPDFEDFGLGCFLLGASEYYKLVKD